MSENKIGSDVLRQGGLPQRGLIEKKRQELLRKIRDEKRKKVLHLDDLEGRKRRTTRIVTECEVQCYPD